MTEIKLSFVTPVHTAGEVTLRFGAADVPPAPAETSAYLYAVLPAPVLAFSAVGDAVLAHGASADIALPAPALAFGAAGVGEQDLALGSRIAVDVSAFQGHGARTTRAADAGTAHALRLGVAARAWHGHGAALSAGAGAQTAHAQRFNACRAAGTAHALPVATAAAARTAHMLRLSYARAGGTAHGLPVAHGAGAGTAHMLSLHRAADAATAHALALAITSAVGGRHGRAVDIARAHAWAQAIYPGAGFWHPHKPPPAPQPGTATEHWLRFANETWRRNVLRFGVHRGRRGHLPIKEYYKVINEFSLRLADSLEHVDVTGFNAQIGMSAWCWSWSASTHGTLFDLLGGDDPDGAPGLIASINGNDLALTLGPMDSTDQFESHTLQLSGASPAEVLAAPSAAERTLNNPMTRTAYQLLEDALTENGVSNGWSIDWQIDDWLVPANAWAFFGTPIAAAMRIAEAGGGYIQAHNTLPTLRVLPRYPLPPWLWHTLDADVSIPAEAARVIGLRRVDMPRYNAVYIAGPTYTDRYRRAGTDGNALAPMIVDALATAPEATLQRGRAAVSNTGRQWFVTLELMVLPETGLIMPGSVVDFVDGGRTRRGIARSLGVNVQPPRIMQRVEIETHLEAV